MSKGYEVEFVLDRAEGSLVDATPQGSTTFILNSKRVLQSLPKLVRYLRTQKPDILLSNLGHNNIIALWARTLALSTTKVITVQHNMLSAESNRGGLKYRYLPLFYRLFLSWSDAIVAVSRGIGEDLSRLSKIPMQRISVIYNGVVTPDFESRASQEVGHPWLQNTPNAIPVFVAIGRLVEQKDFPTLLQAFAQVVAQHQAQLIILGEGPLLNSLMQLTQQLGIADKVDFIGYQQNPLPYMRHADIVVLSSRYEGFAIVVAEALACGTKVVSTNCPEGPAEILENGKYGALVPVGDHAAMAEAMLKTLDTDMNKEQLKQRGYDFSVVVCGEQYLKLF